MLGVGAAVSIFLLMILPTSNVIARGSGGGELSGVVESSEILFAISGMLGLGLAQMTRDHVSTDVLTARLPLRLSRLLQVGGLAVAAVWLAWIAVLSFERAVSSVVDLEVRFGLFSFPIWPARVAIVLGFVSLFAMVVLDIFDLVRGAPRAEAENVAAEERNAE